MKTQTRILLVLLIPVFVFSSCAPKQQYTRENYSKEELLKQFDQNKGMFYATRVFIDSDDYWNSIWIEEHADSYAWIGSPYDKRVDGLDEENRRILFNFFEKMKPYQISVVKGVYIYITFINEDNTGGYQLISFSSSADAKKIKSIISRYNYSERVDEQWFLCYYE